MATTSWAKVYGKASSASGILPGRRPWVRWRVTSQSTKNRTSKVEWQVGSDPINHDLTSGTFSGTVTVSKTATSFSASVPANKSNTMKTGTRTVKHNADGTMRMRIKLTGRIAGTTGWIGTSLNTSVTLPKIAAASKPGTPGAPTLSRVSDTKVKVSWPAVSGADSYVVQFSQNGGAWTTLGSFTSRQSTRTIAANGRIRYRVAARNAGGTSAYSSASAYFYTPPKAPTGVKGTPVEGGIQVTWSPQARYKYGAQVEQRSTGARSLVGTGTATAPTSFVSEVVSVTGEQYRVRAFAGPAASRVYSAWSAWSAKVVSLQTNHPPTGLSPNGGYIAASSEPPTLRWQYNPADGTAQETAQLRFRSPDGEWTAIGGPNLITGAHEYQVTQSRWEWMQAEGPEIEWQARTQGLNGVYSDWSATAVLTIIERPEVAITVPAPDADGGAVEAWESNELTAHWDYAQGEGFPQSGWEAMLTQDGSILETLSGSGDANHAEFETTLENESEYEVQVRAQTVGIWSEWATVTFATLFVPPAPPLVDVAWNETTGAHLVSVGEWQLIPPKDGAVPYYAADSSGVPPLPPAGTWVPAPFEPDEGATLYRVWQLPDGTYTEPEEVDENIDPPPTVFVRLYRSLDQGDTWQPVTLLEEPPIEVTDFQGMSAGTTLYRARAYTEAYATADTIEESETDSPIAWLAAGPEYEDPLRLAYNQTLSRTTGRARDTQTYLGREFPVAYAGANLADEFTVGGTLLAWDEDTASPHELVGMAQLAAATFLWRDPDGHHVYASIGQPQLTRDNHVMVGWSLELVRVDTPLEEPLPLVVDGDPDDEAPDEQDPDGGGGE